jgi:hypothetical protein
MPKGYLGNRDILAMGVYPENEGLPVENAFAGTLAVGTLVYVSGVNTTATSPHFGKLKVDKADANGTTPANVATYVVVEAIPQSGFGRVARAAVIINVDTSAYTTVGDKAYLSITAGATTETAPTGGATTVQPVGFCAVKSSTVGVVTYDLRSNVVRSTGNAGLTAGILSADATGRALMAADYFGTAAVVDDKFAVDTIGEDLLTPAELGSRVMAVTAPAVAGALVAGNLGVPLILPLIIAAGTTGNVDFTGVPFKVRVHNVTGIKTTAAGGGAGTVQVMNGATTDAITDAISIDVADQTEIEALTINDAFWTLDAAATIRVVRTRTASSSEACVLFLHCIRVS